MWFEIILFLIGVIMFAIAFYVSCKKDSLQSIDATLKRIEIILQQLSQEEKTDDQHYKEVISQCLKKAFSERSHQEKQHPLELKFPKLF